MNNKIYTANLLYNLDELTENSLSLRKQGLSYIVWKHFEHQDEKDNILYIYNFIFYKFVYKYYLTSY